MSSPSKDELKKQLAKLQEEVEKSRISAEQLDEKIASTSHTSGLNKKKKKNEDDSVTESDSDVSLTKNNSSDWQDSENNNENRHDLKILNSVDDKENNPKNITLNKKSPEEVITKNITDDCNDPDLYGKDWPEENMIKLMNKIYCKESECKICKTLCSQASHVVRRLITGVFKPSGYLNATLTGQAPRAHLQKGKPAPVKAINAVAKDEIIDYTIAIAREKKWVTPKGVPQTRERLSSIMSQRIGELKIADHANKQA